MKRAFRILGLVVAHALMVALIAILILANWFPAIYTSDWFQKMFGGR